MTPSYSSLQLFDGFRFCALRKMSFQIQQVLAIFPPGGEPWVPDLCMIDEQPFFKLTLGSQQFRNLMQLSYRECLGFSSSPFLAELLAARSLACKPPAAAKMEVGQNPFANVEVPSVIEAVLPDHPQGKMQMATANLLTNSKSPILFAFTTENLDYVKARLLADYSNGFDRVKRQTRKVDDGISFLKDRDAFCVKYKLTDGRARLKTIKIMETEGGREEALQKAIKFRDDPDHVGQDE
jgi:hypothetical protein